MMNRFAKSLAALTMAASLAFSLVGCTLSTPATVGSIGGVEIPAGLYLLAQYNAYQNASSQVEDSKDVLGSKIKESEQTGAEYITVETLQALDSYAQTELRFAELSGVLSEEVLANVASQVETLYTQNKETYDKNGIGRASVEKYVTNVAKQSALLDLVYGTDGSEPVSEAALKAWVEQNYVRGGYISLPIIDFTNYVMLTEEQTTQMKALAEKAAGQVNGGKTLKEIAEDILKESCEIMGTEYSESVLAANLGESTFGPSQMTYYGEEGAAALKNSVPGKATVVNVGTGLLVFVRAESAIQNGVLPTDALYSMKGEELQAALKEQGAALEHQLDAKAMATYSPKKIKK